MIASRRRHSGFSLMELMVALAIGLVLVLALLVILVNVNRSNTDLSRNNSVIENGRFTLQMLETDISHAGFWAGFVPQFDDLSLTPGTSGTSPGDVPAAIPDPCLSYTVANWTQTYVNELIGIPIQVYEVSSSGTAPTVGTCSLFANMQPKTHVVVVRHLADCTAGSNASDEDCTKESGSLYFQMYRCSTTTTPAVGYMFTTATDAALSNFTLTNRDCATVADVYKYVSHIYWVRNYSVTVGDGIPTLMRSTFKQVGGTLQYATSDALIEGIEGFRVDLGIDTTSRSGATLATSDFSSPLCWDTSCSASPTEARIAYNRGDGSPDSYVQCTASSACTVLQLMNVVAVKVNLLVRAPTRTPGYAPDSTKSYSYTLGTGTNAITITDTDDGYRRHLYTQAIRLVNVSTRRELPP